MKIINKIKYEFNKNRKHWIVEGVEDSFEEDYIEIASEIDGYPVKDIGSFAFSNCKTLEEVVLPDSVYQICSYAFNNCKNLRTVTVNSVHLNIYIHGNAFCGCEKLESVNAKNNQLTLLCDAFKGCKNLKYIVGEISLLGNYALLDCDNLKALIFADKAIIDEHGLMSATTERLIFQGAVDIKTPNSFKHLFKYNLKETSIRCTTEFPYTDWVYDGLKMFVVT